MRDQIIHIVYHQVIYSTKHGTAICVPTFSLAKCTQYHNPQDLTTTTDASQHDATTRVKVWYNMTRLVGHTEWQTYRQTHKPTDKQTGGRWKVFRLTDTQKWTDRRTD